MVVYPRAELEPQQFSLANGHANCMIGFAYISDIVEQQQNSCEQ